MPATARANTQPLTEATLKEIEANALSGYHKIVIQEFQQDPPSFNNFKALKYLEFNARSLADDYIIRVQKNLVPHNEHLVSIAKSCANRSNYEIIIDAEKNKQYLRNGRMLEMLIKTLKDCQNAAKILATHRSKARENAVQEQLLSGNAVIQQHTASIPRMQQQLDLLMGRIGFNQTQPAALERQHSQEMNNVQQNVQPSKNNDANQQHPEAAALNPEAPSWTFISRQDCQSLRNSCQDKDSFIRAFALKLFTLCEILQPLNEISLAKEMEAEFVVQHFYGPDENWGALFSTIMKSLRINKRHNIFKKIVKKGIGYGITNTGNIDFYFKCPLSNTMECFSNEKCSRSFRLETQTVGNYRVPTTPTTCDDFNYILFIEKPGRYANFFKLYNDGRMINLPN